MAQDTGVSEAGKGDLTVRVEKAVASAISDPAYKATTRSYKLITICLALISAGWITHAVQSDYATKKDVEKVAAASTAANVATQKALDDHKLESAAKFGDIEAQNKFIEDDYHWMMQQTRAIADTVHAPRVPLPSHIQNK